MRQTTLWVTLIWALSGCDQTGDGSGTLPESDVPTAVTDERLTAADGESENWLTYGRTYSEQRHSPLEQINESNVGRLGLAWSMDLGTNRAAEATPLVDGGVIYTTTAWSILYALNAATGEVLWRYDPEVPKEHARFACCDVVNRGPALYEGKVYAGTIDGRLVSVDAESGELVWETQTTPRGQAYTITGAPRIANGRVVIGNGGAEFGVRGFVSAYDAETGELDWRTYTVPGDPAQPFESEAMRRAAETWSGEWWTAGGGGTAWDSMVYDPELDLLYVGTGNGSPWYRRLRSPGGGDNLYLSSIIALRADDGELVWHYQTTPGDNWDYTATQPLMLADLVIGGQNRQVIMQAPKNGFFYVIDRNTGELISASAFARMTWATGIDSDGRPIETPAARDLDGPTVVWPAPNGAHNWHPMAYNPSTGLVYLPVYESPTVHSVDDEWIYDARRVNIGMGANRAMELLEDLTSSGRLVAWDPVANEEVWRVEQPLPVSGGVLSTAANLIFQGRADGRLRAYRASDGEVLWEYETGRGIGAGPMTYSVDGVQYVAVMTGWGGPEVLLGTTLGPGRLGEGRLLSFRLDGDGMIDVSETPPQPIPMPTFSLEASIDDVADGATLYSQYCVGCHGIDARGSGIIPDLRRTTLATHEVFAAIVIGGARAVLGMPSYEGDLSAEQVRMIQAYVLERAREDAGTL